MKPKNDDVRLHFVMAGVLKWNSVNKIDFYFFLSITGRIGTSLFDIGGTAQVSPKPQLPADHPEQIDNPRHRLAQILTLINRFANCLGFLTIVGLTIHQPVTKPNGVNHLFKKAGSDPRTDSMNWLISSLPYSKMIHYPEF
jgi:hypothetical protein